MPLQSELVQGLRPCNFEGVPPTVPECLIFWGTPNLRQKCHAPKCPERQRVEVLLLEIPPPAPLALLTQVGWPERVRKGRMLPVPSSFCVPYTSTARRAWFNVGTPEPTGHRDTPDFRGWCVTLLRRLQGLVDEFSRKTSSLRRS